MNAETLSTHIDTLLESAESVNSIGNNLQFTGYVPDSVAELMGILRQLKGEITELRAHMPTAPETIDPQLTAYRGKILVAAGELRQLWKTFRSWQKTENAKALTMA